MINKFEEDRLKHRNVYIKEIFKRNDLFRQLGKAREEYEERARRYDEEKIEDEMAINNLFKNITLSREFELENKHIIEQLTSIFDDKDEYIEEFKKNINDALKKINDISQELDSTKLFKKDLQHLNSEIKKENTSLKMIL